MGQEKRQMYPTLFCNLNLSQMCLKVKIFQ
uniref:Uncharacterized protein n=1 Tax=Rhizophora mucronata TaxID=61149 RepID=A0A2P2R4T6_RHIMU